MHQHTEYNFTLLLQCVSSSHDLSNRNKFLFLHSQDEWHAYELIQKGNFHNVSTNPLQVEYH